MLSDRCCFVHAQRWFCHQQCVVRGIRAASPLGFEAARCLKATRDAQQLLFPFSYTQAAQKMEDAVEQLCCQRFRIMSYALRHGGASEYRAVTRTRERPGTTLEKASTRALTATWSIGRVFLSIFNAARPVVSIMCAHGYGVFFRTLLVDQRLTLDNLVWPQKCWDGLRQASSWVCGVERHRWTLCNGILKIVHVGRFLRACAALGIPAGEHSPFDSSLRKRPLRSRLMQRWSFVHVDFCADGARFRKRTGMLFIHCGTPSCRHVQRRSAHRVCTFIGNIQDKIIRLRCRSACRVALLSLSRTSHGIV